MKLTGAAAERFLSAPDAKAPALLIYGQDSDRVARRRAQIALAVGGPDADADMRLTRMMGAEARKDPAALTDAMKATGFFPGQRLLIVEEAADGLTKALQQTLDDWEDGDAMMIVTAGNLSPRSSLRKLFETHKTALCLPVYRDPPSRAQIEAALAKAGLHNVPTQALADLTQLAQSQEPGDFDQTLEKLALYKLGDDDPVNAEDIAACAPATTEASVDQALDLVVSSSTGQLAQMFARLSAQGIAPTSICIAAERQFRTLHALAVHPDGPDTAASRVRPPLFGPRRATMVREARRWGRDRLERALSMLLEADMQLRSSTPVPAGAMLERVLIRISMLGKR